MSAKISKCLCRNLLIRAATQIKAVYKDHETLVTLKRCITLSFKLLDSQHKISIVLYCCTYKNIFRFFGDSANKTRILNLELNCKELRPFFLHHVNVVYRVYKCSKQSVPKYLRLFEQVDTLHFYIIFISIIILLSL